MPIEMLSGFTANISTETQIQQNRRYTTIQLDIIHTGDCLNILKTLPDDSVHCCVTSPPYYALRDYGMEAQIGRETTPKEYISRLTEVFTEVRRVLRPDGTLWLNISDTYAGKGNQGDFIDPKNPNGRNGQAVALNNKVEGCKAKDMIGIPWMLAFALRDTDVYKRQTMCIEDIKALPVGELAAKDCALFLWITFPCLCEALEVLTAWGFSYKTVAFVWVKQNRRNDDLFTGMGYWTRANAEICILATKGHPKRVDAGVRQVILSHIEEHSKKPDEARERIVRLMGDLPRVELFARQSPEGWDVWGNEVECSITLGKTC